jgi:hypothetical protein
LEIFLSGKKSFWLGLMVSKIALIIGIVIFWIVWRKISRHNWKILFIKKSVFGSRSLVASGLLMATGTLSTITQKTIIRRRKNKILTLRDDAGNWIDEPENLKSLVRQFYVDLFTEDTVEREHVVSWNTYPNYVERHHDRLSAQV